LSSNLGSLSVYKVYHTSSNQKDWVTSSPTAVFNGKHYMVVFKKGYDTIVGYRVSTSMTLMDTTPNIIRTGISGGGGPYIAFNGTDQLLVWIDSGTVRGARIAP